MEEDKIQIDEHSTHEEMMDDINHSSSDEGDAIQLPEDFGNATDFVRKLLQKYSQLFEIQELVEKGEFHQNGPGRRRENPYRMASEIRRIAMSYLRKAISNILNNPTSKSRKDGMMTFFFRAMKKLALFLKDHCSTKNLYKESDINSYATSFVESHFAFLASINSLSSDRLLDRFAEFIILWFPEDKAQAILLNLMSSELVDGDCVRMQLKLLNREQWKKTSKQHLLFWARNSWTMRQIMSMAIQILDEPKFRNNKLAKHLSEISSGIMAEIKSDN